MKMNVFAILSVIIFCFSCSPNSETINTTAYEFITSKTELRDENKIDIYSLRGVLNIEELKSFCLIKKNEWKLSGFYIIVIFDNKNNVIPPKSPILTTYEIDEFPQKHIKAVYTFNKHNGYSKLDYYDKNKWESVVKSYNI